MERVTVQEAIVHRTLAAPRPNHLKFIKVWRKYQRKPVPCSGTQQIQANDCSTLPMKRSSYETFIATLIALAGLHRPGAAPAAQCGACADLDLPANSVAAGRLQLSAPADLFGLWRRGDRALRAVGRRVDDAGAAITLSALGDLGDRQCAADVAPARAMGSALAGPPMARRETPPKRPPGTGNAAP